MPSQLALYHIHFPLSMRILPLVGVGTTAATALAGVGHEECSLPRAPWRYEKSPEVPTLGGRLVA